MERRKEERMERRKEEINDGRREERKEGWKEGTVALPSKTVVCEAHILTLTLRRRIKSHLLFAGIIRSSPFSLR